MKTNIKGWITKIWLKSKLYKLTIIGTILLMSAWYIQNVTIDDLQGEIDATKDYTYLLQNFITTKLLATHTSSFIEFLMHYDSTMTVSGTAQPIYGDTIDYKEYLKIRLIHNRGTELNHLNNIRGINEILKNKKFYQYDFDDSYDPDLKVYYVDEWVENERLDLLNLEIQKRNQNWFITHSTAQQNSQKIISENTKQIKKWKLAFLILFALGAILVYSDRAKKTLNS